jgi:hypothetical protein
MGGNMSNVGSEMLSLIEGNVYVNTKKNPYPKVKFDGEIEIYSVGDLFSNFILNVDQGNHLFIASSKEYTEYGKIWKYRIGMGFLIILLIIQFFYNYK